MAEKLSITTDSATANLNIGARGDQICNGFKQIYDLEQNIISAREKHMKPLTDARTKKWRGLKKDLNITREVLEAQYRLYSVRQDALENEDGGDEALDNMRELHNALKKGGMLDWIDAVEGAQEAA